MVIPQRTSIIILTVVLFLAGGFIFLYWEAGDYEYEQYMQTTTQVHVSNGQITKNKSQIIDQSFNDQKEQEIEKVAEKEVPKEISTVMSYNVPFAAQAPFGGWDDPRQQDGCEEMSMIMAMHWVNNTPLTLREAYDELMDIVGWEQDTYGYYEDTSATTTAYTIQTYYDHEQVYVIHNPAVEDIISALNRNSVVLAPTDGRLLYNPYFTPPGPDRHMVVITGYDMASQEFITNDPGTRRGENVRYTFTTLMNAIVDYPSGKHEKIDSIRKAVIVVEKKNGM